MTVRAITFDAGGTLFRTVSPVGEIYAAVAARHGYRADAGVIQERFLSAWSSRSGVAPAAREGAPVTAEHERAWWREVVRDVFEGGEAFEDFDRFFTELHDLFAEPRVWQLFPEVAATLERLRREGIRLAIVSNWDSRLEPLTRKLGIRDAFETVVASGAAGVSKPSPAIFAQALGRLGVEPAEAAHVGDSLRDDVWGAVRAGMRPVWLRRPEARPFDPAGREFEALMQRGVATADTLDAAAGLALT